MYSPKLYLRDWWIAAPLGAIAAIQGLMWWYVFSHIHPAAEQIFLHYNVIFGVDLVGDWWRIFYLPAGGAIIFLANYPLSFLFYRGDRFLARLLAVATAAGEAFLLLAVVLIVGLNI